MSYKASIFILLLSSQVLAKTNDTSTNLFHNQLTRDAKAIWTTKLPNKLRSSIQAYNSQTKLKNGLTYGSSVRNFSIKNKCIEDIETHMKKLNCTKQIDVLKRTSNNKPVYTPSRKTIPIWQYICPDGGVFKVKPIGNPISKYTPFPHGSRVLRYPASSPYRDYRDEVAKVSETGFIVPRSPRYLKTKHLIDGWSKSTHPKVRNCK